MDVDKIIGAVASLKTVQSSTIASSENTFGMNGTNQPGRHGKSGFQDPAITITRKLEMIRSLRTLLDSLRDIHEALSPSTSKLFVLASEFLRDPMLEDICVIIQKLVNRDSIHGLPKGGIAKQNIHAYAIKTGTGNELLDVA